MPFFLIPAALGVCFLLIWIIIGGMIFHDGQAAQHDIDADIPILLRFTSRLRRLPLSKANSKRQAAQLPRD